MAAHNLANRKSQLSISILIGLLDRTSGYAGVTHLHKEPHQNSWIYPRVKTIHSSLRKKTSVAREHKRRNICKFSRTGFVVVVVVVLLKWTKSEKEVIYGKKNRGHRAFKRVKSLRSSQNDGIFALSRHCVTFPRRPGSTAIP